MGKVLIQMSMSLDGYVAGPNDGETNPLGDHGRHLHDWLFPSSRGSAPGTGLAATDQAVFDDLRTRTGAMICGRRLYDITHGWNGSHPFGAVPVIVVTHDAPQEVPSGVSTFTFVTDGIARAVDLARDAAGAKDVYVIGGATIDRQLLELELADEVRIDLVPILLGGGVRLFDALPRVPIFLEPMAVAASSRVTHLRYGVVVR